MEPHFSPLFPATDRSAWLVQVQKELKDANAYESLRWHTDEGFTMEPYYTADDLTPSLTRPIQSAQKATPGWLNTPEYRITQEKADNTILRDALARGADALLLNLSLPVDLVRLLHGIKLSENPVFFRFRSALPANTLAEFTRALKTVAPHQLKGGLLVDASADSSAITRLTADSPQFRTLCASGHPFHNAGATATQELAFTLASLTDTYDKLTDEGLSVAQLASKTLFSVSVGTSYFMEIAKLRALRVLFAQLLGHYSESIDQAQPFVHVQTSTFYDATATSYTNLLRSTTESMAAVLGGCDALTVHPYDAVLGQANEFSERIARNVSILLKTEGYLGKVADPSAGSYYIETLTHKLVEAAWALFLDIENRGGFAKALADGFVQSEIERSYQKKVQAVQNGKVLVGVNAFRFDDTVAQNQTDPDSEIPTDLLPNRRLPASFE